MDDQYDYAIYINLPLTKWDEFENLQSYPVEWNICSYVARYIGAAHLPFGRRLHSEMENHHEWDNWKTNEISTGPCSMSQTVQLPRAKYLNKLRPHA